MIYTLHVLEHIRDRYPDAEITLYCKKFNFPLIAGLDVVNQMADEKDKLTGKYDLQINLRSDWPMFFRAFRAKRRLERGCIRLQNKLRGGQTHEVYTNFNTIKPVLPKHTEMKWPHIVDTAEDEEEVEQLLKSNGIDRFALIHAGARDIARRWPAERFAAIADWLSDQYGLQVVFGGGPNEKEEIDHILEYCQKTHFNFAGRTTLTQFAALCKKAVVFIGNESGPMHIANVTNTPLVALFGPGVREVFYPYGDNVKILHHYRDPKTQRTLTDSTIFLITEEEVKKAVAAIYPRNN